MVSLAEGGVGCSISVVKEGLNIIGSHGDFVDEHAFPSDSREARGRFVGIATTVGHRMTFKVLSDDTQKIMYRSRLRPAKPDAPNLRIEPPGGEADPIIKGIKKHPDPPWQNGEFPDGETSEPNTADSTEAATFSPDDLVGRSFLLPPRDDGQRFRARIIQSLEDNETDLQDNPTRRKFIASVNDDQFQEIYTFAQISDFINEAENNSDTTEWKFKRITAHEGPLRVGHPNHKGSSYNVMIEWENGEVTAEPLKTIGADDPVTCALYAKENGLLDTPGWRRFKDLAKRAKKFLRAVNQAKLRSYNTAPRYKYGFEVPRNYKNAKDLDRRNGNTRWQDAVDLEMSQLDEYSTFKNNGPKIPAGHQKLRIHLVFDVKHDGRHKARMVADGHLTDIPLESVYSGVVSIRGLRMVAFLAELNQLELWSTDIGNAYLEALTKEKLYIIAGPEFNAERQGCVLIVHKALYGLRTSGKRWHERFAECMRGAGFAPCKLEPDIWMRKCPTKECYEYVASYVDDLAIAMDNPQELIDILERIHKFKLKGTGKIKMHLGIEFFRDPDGVLCMSAAKFIDKVVDEYERHFGCKPDASNCRSPIAGGSHPELDVSEYLDEKGITQYQSLIGSLQWAITIGRCDIATAVMTLSSFRVAPRRGHLDCVKRVCGYIYRMKHAAIRIRIGRPDFSDIPVPVYDWTSTIYGETKEVVPDDIPEPLGETVSLTSHVDANLYHDMLTGRAVTGILHFVNQMPLDWYSKKQATVETATYGSEFVAARIATDQVIDIRNTFRYLGVPIEAHTTLFGDNKSVVDSSSIPHHKLNKRHNALSFHRVREAIASTMLRFHHIDGTSNPADILSKHWDYSAVWPQLQPLLFYSGDTAGLLN